jgi:hypothetical protein
MSAVVEIIEAVASAAVEVVGAVVETVVDVVDEVAVAVDKYVIQPILDDPLTAIATVAAASFLGPTAAAFFGTNASVGVGIAAGLGNTAAGLVQGEDFETAIKGGLAAGVGSYAGAELFGPSVDLAEVDPLDQLLLDNNNFSNVQLDTPQIAPPVPDLPAAAPSAVPVPDVVPPVPLAPEMAASVPAPSPLESVAPPVTTPGVSSPLETLKAALPKSEVTFPDIPEFKPDFRLDNGLPMKSGLQAPEFALDAPVFDLYGNPDYSLTPPGMTGGPGLQIPSAPSLPSMGGGQGLTYDKIGLPQYTESGVPTTFEGASGKTYGNMTPDVTVSQNAIRTTPANISYDATTNSGTPPAPTAFDQIKSGDFGDAAKTLGGDAVDWVKNASPWTLGGAALGAASLLGGSGNQGTVVPPKAGSTQDKNFTKSLDLYNYMRDKNNYSGDLTKYGQVGQANPGEHQFFQNTKFVPIPIQGQPAKMGGLIQMKHFAQGGPAQGMQDPRRAQMMPGGQMPQRPPMIQQQGGPQRMPPQGMQQGRPQMPQRPRDPKMAYYQYGNPPAQAMAMGGLSQVHSMRIGGGADGRSDDVNAVLSDGEYVMDAESVAMLGNGSSKAGAAKLDQMRSNLRKQKGQALANGKISPDAMSPLAYLKGA